MKKLTKEQLGKEIVEIIVENQHKLSNDELREKIIDHGKEVEFIPFNKEEEE